MTKKTQRKNGGAFNQSILEIIRDEGDNHLDPLKENSKETQEKLEQLQFIKSQEKLIYTQKDQEEETKIKEILEEIKALKKGLKNLDKEIDKTIEQAPVAIGTYHINFFEKIKENLVLLRKKVEETSSWLEVFNKRTAKKNYWSSFKKTGTQWSMSGERYITTSVG